MDRILRSQYDTLQRIGVMVLLGSAFVLAPSWSHAQTNVPEVNNSLFVQLITAMESLQQVAALTAGSFDTPAAPAAGCVDNKISYPHNRTIPALTLANGLKSSSKGNEYRCNNGRWIFQSIPKVTPVNPASTTATSSASGKKCVVGSRSYNSGVEIRREAIWSQTMLNNKEQDKQRLSPTYVCRNGTWVPVVAEQASCKLRDGSSAPHGTVASSSRIKVQNTPGGLTASGRVSSRPDTIIRYTCMNGAWVNNNQSCRVGNREVRDGSVSTSTSAYDHYGSRFPSLASNASFAAILKQMKWPLTCRNGAFSISQHENPADKSPSFSGSRSSAAGTVSNPGTSNQGSGTTGTKSSTGTSGTTEAGKYGPQ